MRYFLALICLIFICQPLHASKLKICYEAKYLIKLGESCIKYEMLSENVLHIKSEVHTTGFVRALHELDLTGQSFINLTDFSPTRMSMREKTSKYLLENEYIFDGKIHFTQYKTKFKNDVRKKRKDGFFENRKNLLEPFSASAAIQTDGGAIGNVEAFYEGDTINIPYSLTGYGYVYVQDKRYLARIIELSPLINKNSSKLKPKGKWSLYVHEETGMLLRIEVEFSIGKVVLNATSVTGDTHILADNVSLF